MTSKRIDQIDIFRREIEAVSAIRAHIADLAEGEDAFIADTLEGEANFADLVHRLVSEANQAKAMASAIDAYINEMMARLNRYNSREGTFRALIETAINISGRAKIETPSGTVSIKAVAEKAIVTDEAKIPSRFWVAQPPKLDKKALLNALKEGEVEGAELSNGGTTIQIRK